jgi:SAM-dependent methyltransferase
MANPMDYAESAISLVKNRDASWAWRNYTAFVVDIIKEAKRGRVMEVGGGRFPNLTKDIVDALDIEYTSNDISMKELDLAPPWVRKACFDISTKDGGELSNYYGGYDVIYSKMVMEHVSDYRSAYRNISQLLAPSGISIAFHPTLYCPPFVLNKLIPEDVSRRLLQAVFRNRTDSGIPKFPAQYSGCVISDRIRENIRKLGFKKVWQLPFFGHDYYSRIPILKQWEQFSTKQLVDLNLTFFSSFSYTIALK